MLRIEILRYVLQISNHPVVSTSESIQLVKSAIAEVFPWKSMKSKKNKYSCIPNCFQEEKVQKHSVIPKSPPPKKIPESTKISQGFDSHLKLENPHSSRWPRTLSASDKLRGKKRPWSDEEDNLVIHLVEKYGPQKWTFIAEHLPGRIGKQCRERFSAPSNFRWHNHLNPRIKKESWTDEEEWVLFLVTFRDF